MIVCSIFAQHFANTSSCWLLKATSCREKLAYVTTDKVVFLHDSKGEMQDKFKAKANSAAADYKDVSDGAFAVLDMAYSSDSTRLALAQSDNILYVYKLGLEWKEKKSITNKFATQVRL